MPFGLFYKQQWQRQKLLSTPSEKAQREALENDKNLRVGDYVYVNFQRGRLGRAYDVQRGRIFRLV